MDYAFHAAPLNAIVLSDTGSVAGDFLTLFRMLIIRFALYCLMFMRRSSIVEYINHFFYNQVAPLSGLTSGFIKINEIKDGRKRAGLFDIC